MPDARLPVPESVSTLMQDAYMACDDAAAMLRRLRGGASVGTEDYFTTVEFVENVRDDLRAALAGGGEA